MQCCDATHTVSSYNCNRPAQGKFARRDELRLAKNGKPGESWGRKATRLPRGLIREL